MKASTRSVAGPSSGRPAAGTTPWAVHPGTGGLSPNPDTCQRFAPWSLQV